jgi:hypothetical protein
MKAYNSQPSDSNRVQETRNLLQSPEALNETKFLKTRKMSFDELRGLIERVLGIDCRKCVFIGYGNRPATFALGFQDGTQKHKPHTIKTYPLGYFVDENLKMDQNTFGDILANLEYGGFPALSAYTTWKLDLEKFSQTH